MNLPDLSHYKSLGVINMTPDSFSDHGLSLNPDYLKNQIQTFLKDPSVILDFGFESTAPINSAITYQEEMSRFDYFLQQTKAFDFNNRYISFDTYKVKNFLEMTEKFKKYHPNTHFIFNDVSGVLDEELKSALLRFKGLNFYYIYTFSHIPERSKVLDHMKYAIETEDSVEACAHAFSETMNWFKQLGMDSQVILDPGFGFSKTYDQNWSLVNDFPKLESQLRALKIENPVLIGLSKKSFLKKALGHGAEVSLASLEHLHKDCITLMKKDSKKQLLFRVHNLSVL